MLYNKKNAIFSKKTKKYFTLFQPKAAEPPTEVPQERWVDPLPEKLQFQQQENKFAELKCKYSRANAKGDY